MLRVIFYGDETHGIQSVKPITHGENTFIKPQTLEILNCDSRSGFSHTQRYKHQYLPDGTKRFFFVLAACGRTPLQLLFFYRQKFRDDHARRGIRSARLQTLKQTSKKQTHNPNHWRFLVVGEVLMVKKNPGIQHLHGNHHVFQIRG